MAQQPKQRRQSTFTNSGWSSYDNTFSAMSFVMANDAMLLQFAPILPDMVGRTPKKGEKVYDYDNKVNVSLTAHAVQLQQAVDFLLDSDDSVKSVQVGGEFEGASSITIFKPHGIKLNGQSYDNFVMRIEVTRDGDTIKAYHVLQSHVILIHPKEKGADVQELEVQTDLEVLVKACDAALENAFQGAHHGAKQAGGSSGSSEGARRSRMAQVAEDDEDDEETTASARKSARSLADDFEDEEESSDGEEKPKASSARARRMAKAKPGGESKASDDLFDEDVPQ